MRLLKIAAFCAEHSECNPVGVVLAADPSTDADMQRIAREPGFSETAFAMPAAGGWRVRYFSPSAEIPFCGHATIALGAALASQRAEGAYVMVV